MLSSASEDENEAPALWVNNSAYTLNCHDSELVLSRKGWLTDKIICAAQMILLQYFPSMAGLQPPTLQKHNSDIQVCKQQQKARQLK